MAEPDAEAGDLMTTKEGRIANRKPTCNICGEKHWPRELHIVGGTDRAKTVQSAPRGKNRTAPDLSPFVVEPRAVGEARGRSFDALGKAWCAGWRCRCGHEWLTKGERPTRCPKCKARTWDRGGKP